VFVPDPKAVRKLLTREAVVKADALPAAARTGPRSLPSDGRAAA
jgi:hypothetical protein